MKNAAACFLFATYVLVSAASALHLHYCAAGWMTAFNMEQGASGTDCAACHHDKKNKDCCKHPKIQVNVNPNQLLPGICTFKAVTFTLPHTFFNKIHQDKIFNETFLALPAHAQTAGRLFMACS
jgi:hypothetical protein